MPGSGGHLELPTLHKDLIFFMGEGRKGGGGGSITFC